MATTQRESPLGSVKDKKPTRSLPRISSTPSLIPTLGRRAPKETTSYTTSTNKARNVTSPSSPTCKLVKKHSPNDSSSKAAPNRRSFQKPHPIVTRKHPSKAHPKSGAPSQPVRTVRRSMTAPASPRKGAAKAPSSPQKRTCKKGSIDVEPTLMPCGEAEFGDGYALSGEIEEIANIGSDEDLVPFDQMELSEINPCTSVDVVKPDLMILVPCAITPNEVEASNQQGEDHGIGTADHESNMATTRDFEGGNKLDEEKQGREAERPRPKPEPKKQQQHGDKDRGKDSPVYNDVIEETANKLLEKRKNKVRALVGAFETVISLQD